MLLLAMPSLKILKHSHLICVFRRVVLYVSYGVEKGHDVIVVRTVDSDLFFTLLHHCFRWPSLKKLIYDVGTGNNDHIIGFNPVKIS